jgi:hypothetical protein
MDVSEYRPQGSINFSRIDQELLLERASSARGEEHQFNILRIHGSLSLSGLYFPEWMRRSLDARRTDAWDKDINATVIQACTRGW